MTMRIEHPPGSGLYLTREGRDVYVTDALGRTLVGPCFCYCDARQVAEEIHERRKMEAAQGQMRLL